MMNRDHPLPEIHTLSLTELTARLRISIPSQLRPDDNFFDALSDADQINYRNKGMYPDSSHGKYLFDTHLS